jgi:translation initiation factor 2 alpha subunit (eIF-2alpha)
MEFHEEYGNLNKKLHISEIYKDKFKQAQSRLKEVEERVHQFSDMTD